MSWARYRVAIDQPKLTVNEAATQSLRAQGQAADAARAPIGRV